MQAALLSFLMARVRGVAPSKPSSGKPTFGLRMHFDNLVVLQQFHTG